MARHRRPRRRSTRSWWKRGTIPDARNVDEEIYHHHSRCSASPLPWHKQTHFIHLVPPRSSPPENNGVRAWKLEMHTPVPRAASARRRLEKTRLSLLLLETSTSRLRLPQRIKTTRMSSTLCPSASRPSTSPPLREDVHLTLMKTKTKNAALGGIKSCREHVRTTSRSRSPFALPPM